MKYAYWGFAMLLFGAIGLVVIVMFESITLNNDSEYYVLKEAMEAAMIESIDIDCYRVDTDVNENGCGGQLKISEQKFVENFSRRFASSISGDVSSYTLEFYDIIEMPPKASVNVIGTTKSYSLMVDGSGNGDGSFNLQNALTGILEFNHSNKVNEDEFNWEDIENIIIDTESGVVEGEGYTSVNDIYVEDTSGEVGDGGGGITEETPVDTSGSALFDDSINGDNNGGYTGDVDFTDTQDESDKDVVDTTDSG